MNSKKTNDAEATAPTTMTLDPTATPNGNAEMFATFMASISEAIKSGSLAAVNAVRPHQRSFDDYINDPSPTNRARPAREAKLASTGRTFAQNGVPIPFTVIDDAEMDLLLQIRPGKFVNGLVTIDERERGDGTKRCDIQYASQTPDQRIRLKNEVKNFRELLERCVSESAAVQVVQ